MRLSRKLAWRDASWWLLFTVTGFLLPVLLGGISGRATGADINMEWLAGDGQFALSSAGLLMTTCYFLSKPSPVYRMWQTRWFLFVSLLGLAIVTYFVIMATLKNSGISVDPRYYQLPSILCFGVALIIAFVAVGLDNTRTEEMSAGDEREREIEVPGFFGNQNQAERDQIAHDFESTFDEGGIA